MCGRVAIYTAKGVIVKHFGVHEDRITKPWDRKYNVPPTTRIPVIHTQAARLILSLEHWGLPVESGARLVINARAETLTRLPLFRPAVGQGQAVVPIDGFYEWRTSGRRKQPFLIRRRDKGLMALAALRRRMPLKDGAKEDCVVVITTEANAMMRPIHDRMPVVLDGTEIDEWLRLSGPEPSELRRLLVPAAEEILVAVPVGERVNDAKTEDPSLVRPIATLD